MQYEDNTILIVPQSIKQKILLEINSLKKIINIKIYTINEFISKYYFSYDEKTIYYVSKKYNIKPEIAKIYIENLYYLGKLCDNSKIKFLEELKKDLQKENLITQNELFIESLKNKRIVIVNIPETKYNLRLIKSLKEIASVTISNISTGSYFHNVIHFKTLEEEVVSSANKICELLKQGIDINSIFLTNLSEEHRLIVEKIFSIFKIPVLLKSTESLIGTSLVQKFLKNYQSDINETLSSLRNEINSLNSEIIYNELIRIVNKYYFVTDYNEVKDMIINDLKSTKVNKVLSSNCVKEVSFLEYPFSESDYVFLFNFNQGCIPKIYKDENYLNDKIMQTLELDTAPYLNTLEKERVIAKIKSTKNLFISYIDKSISALFYPSSLISDLKMEIIEGINNTYKYSHIFNKIELAKSLIEYKKYNTLSDSLPILYHNYNLKTYDNSYQQIDKKNLYQFLNNKLNLSYTSLNNYYKCNFSYYLSNILKLDIYEETFMQIVGDIFHEVLEKYFQKKSSFETLYNDAINHMNYEYSLKDRFFLKKLKDELKFVISTIEDQNNYSNLKDELHEEKVVVNIPGNIEVIFSGKIDKVKYAHKEDRTIIAIIDYKTGNPEINLNNVIYGLDMQLPVYIFLAKNSNKLKNIEVAGFYLQKILNNEIVADNKHSYEDLKKDKLKLQGYSNNEYNTICEFDSTYENSKVIKSLKVSKNGFYPYSKVLNSKQIDILTEIVEQKIKEGATNILDAKFSINPVAISNVNIGCKFCNFKNICYMSDKNVNNLKEYKNLEFLGGDNNANMD
ncbi:MAG: PD-(D/E)XK nuclease family protein [Bacilli bacterium]